MGNGAHSPQLTSRRQSMTGHRLRSALRYKQEFWYMLLATEKPIHHGHWRRKDTDVWWAIPRKVQSLRFCLVHLARPRKEHQRSDMILSGAPAAGRGAQLGTSISASGGGVAPGNTQHAADCDSDSPSAGPCASSIFRPSGRSTISRSRGLIASAEVALTSMHASRPLFLFVCPSLIMLWHAVP